MDYIGRAWITLAGLGSEGHSREWELSGLVKWDRIGQDTAWHGTAVTGKDEDWIG